MIVDFDLKGKKNFYSLFYFIRFESSVSVYDYSQQICTITIFAKRFYHRCLIGFERDVY